MNLGHATEAYGANGILDERQTEAVRDIAAQMLPDAGR
jgi:hypothetical protein